MELNSEKTGIIYNPEIEGTVELSKKLAKKFDNSKVFSVFDVEKTSLPTFAIVIGGDGTILKCARYYSKFDIPIFGFNMGRLGFLAQAVPDEADEIIEQIKLGNFKIENRMMLETVANGEKYYALNDFVIKGATFSRTSTYELFINNHFVSGYLADGIIISTPTGSTAYTLSAGGPVIAPDLASIAIVPICPHTLNARPIVVSGDEIIKINTVGCDINKYKVTYDGQNGIEIAGSIEIKKSKISAKLLLLDREQDNFYNVLREKFNWGVAPKKC